VKRVLAAFLVALTSHGVFFVLGFNWRPVSRGRSAPLQPVTLFFNAVQPAAPARAKISKPLPAAAIPGAVEPKKRKAALKPKPIKKPKAGSRPKPATKPKTRPKPPPRKKRVPAPRPSPVLMPKTRTDAETARKTRAAAEFRPPENRPKAPALSAPVGGTKTGSTPAKRRAPAKPGGASSALRRAVPLYARRPAMKYPLRARRRGYQGSVELEVLVGADGKVQKVKVISSSGYKVLDRAAVRWVKQWTFIPAMRGDEKVASWVKVPVRFKLD